MPSWHSSNFSITDVSAFETCGNRETYRMRNGRECTMFEYARRFLYMMPYLLKYGLFKNIICSIRLISIHNKNATITTKISPCLGPSLSPKNVMLTTGWSRCWKMERSVLIWHHVMPIGPIPCSYSIQKLLLKVNSRNGKMRMGCLLDNHQKGRKNHPTVNISTTRNN